MLQLSSGLLFPFDVSDIHFGKKYFESVATHAPDLMPDKYGNCEPIRDRFSYESIGTILQTSWQDMFLWKSTKSKTDGIWGMGTGNRHSSLFFYGNKRTINTSDLLFLYKDMAINFGPVDFGYLHALTDPEWESFMPYAIDMLTPFNSGVTTINLRKCIPNLAWGTLLGGPYVQLIGMDRLLSSPAFKVERWADDLAYIQVSRALNDVESAFGDFDKRRRAIKTHLGDRFFFAPSASRNEMEAPQFTLE